MTVEVSRVLEVRLEKLARINTTANSSRLRMLAKAMRRCVEPVVNRYTRSLLAFRVGLLHGASKLRVRATAKASPKFRGHPFSYSVFPLCEMILHTCTQKLAGSLTHANP